MYSSTYSSSSSDDSKYKNLSFSVVSEKLVRRLGTIFPISVMKKNRCLVSLLLLLIMLAANLSCSKGRSLLGTTDQESRGSSTWKQQMSRKHEKVGKEQGVEDSEASLNNHHTIPRESYGDWDNDPAPPADDQLQPDQGNPT